MDNVLCGFSDNVREELKNLALLESSQKIWAEFNNWLNTPGASCTRYAMKQYSELLSIVPHKKEYNNLQHYLWDKLYEKYNNSFDDIQKQEIYGLTCMFFEVQSGAYYFNKLINAFGNVKATQMEPLLQILFIETIGKTIKAPGYAGTENAPFAPYLHESCKNVYLDFLKKNRIPEYEGRKTLAERYRKNYRDRDYVSNPRSLDAPVIQDNNTIFLSDLIADSRNNIDSWLESEDAAQRALQNQSHILSLKNILTPTQRKVYECCLKYVRNNTNLENEDVLNARARQEIANELGMNAAAFRQSLHRILKVINANNAGLIENLNISSRPNATKGSSSSRGREL